MYLILILVFNLNLQSGNKTFKELLIIYMFFIVLFKSTKKKTPSIV